MFPCILFFSDQDTGPQNPTIVTQMLKYGTNLLQAVGQFNGRLDHLKIDLTSLNCSHFPASNSQEYMLYTRSISQRYSEANDDNDIMHDISAITCIHPLVCMGVAPRGASPLAAVPRDGTPVYRNQAKNSSSN